MLRFAQFAQHVWVVTKHLITVGSHRLEPRLGMTDQSEFAHQTQRAIATALEAFFIQVTVHRPETRRSRNYSHRRRMEWSVT